MLRFLDLRQAPDDTDYTASLPRAEFDVEHAVAAVAPICAAVQAEGEAALRRFSLQFDQVVPESLRVPAEVLERCAANLDPELAAAFAESIRRRRAVLRVRRPIALR